MNPRANLPESQGSQPPVQPEQYTPAPEQQPVPNQEVQPGQERQAEQAQERPAPPPSVTLPPVTAPTDQPAVSPQQQTTTPAGPMPAIADDVDVIEKAWVDKAKQIIKDTHDDPYAQEQAVEQLQIEYMKKRYGKDIKAARG